MAWNVDGLESLTQMGPFQEYGGVWGPCVLADVMESLQLCACHLAETCDKESIWTWESHGGTRGLGHMRAHGDTQE